ncbi:MAG: hypothetical protein DRN54_03985 [Thaumarchaeota archaeon]|nr:MAG: hypothetical protein DRN54_03985 [Nitrososphaerota archaeon]
MNTPASQRTEISLKQMIEGVLAVVWEDLMSMQAYAVFAVIQSSTRMNRVATARTEIVTNASMRGSCERGWQGSGENV